MTKLSVIVPFYKEIFLLKRAVESVISQVNLSNIEIEIIIGNDGSFSEEDIRKQLSNTANSMTTISRNNAANGAGNARNAAINSSNGEIIAFLDADDYWLKDKLYNQLELINNDMNFICGGYLFEGKNIVVRPPKWIGSTFDLLCNTNIGTSTVIITRELLANDRFTNIRFSQDTELWARLSGKKNFRYASVADVCTVYAPSSRTANKSQQFFYFNRIVNRFKLSVSARLTIFSRYFFRGVKNHYLKKLLHTGRTGTNESAPS